MNTGKVIDASQATFEQEVVQRSHQTTVFVDFWAPWCGPCRMLGPLLERIANEPGSGFVLAKVNVDQNQQLSQRFGVRGIPAVKAFKEGRVVDGFVGAQPELMVRQFVQRVGPVRRPQAKRTGADGEAPLDAVARLQQARQHLWRGEGCQAERLLQAFPGGPEAAAAERLRPLAAFLCQNDRGQARSNGQTRFYADAASALKRREPSAALYNLLTAYNQGPAAEKKRASEIMDGIFELLGEQDSLAQQYRRLVASS